MPTLRTAYNHLFGGTDWFALTARAIVIVAPAALALGTLYLSRRYAWDDVWFALAIIFLIAYIGGIVARMCARITLDQDNVTIVLSTGTTLDAYLRSNIDELAQIRGVLDDLQDVAVLSGGNAPEVGDDEADDGQRQFAAMRQALHDIAFADPDPAPGEFGTAESLRLRASSALEQFD